MAARTYTTLASSQDLVMLMIRGQLSAETYTALLAEEAAGTKFDVHRLLAAAEKAHLAASDAMAFISFADPVHYAADAASVVPTTRAGQQQIAEFELSSAEVWLGDIKLCTANPAFQEQAPHAAARSPPLAYAEVMRPTHRDTSVDSTMAPETPCSAQQKSSAPFAALSEQAFKRAKSVRLNGSAATKMVLCRNGSAMRQKPESERRCRPFGANQPGCNGVRADDIVPVWLRGEPEVRKAVLPILRRQQARKRRARMLQQQLKHAEAKRLELVKQVKEVQQVKQKWAQELKRAKAQA